MWVPRVWALGTLWPVQLTRDGVRNSIKEIHLDFEFNLIFTYKIRSFELVRDTIHIGSLTVWGKTYLKSKEKIENS